MRDGDQAAGSRSPASAEAFRRAMEMIGRRWTGAIVRSLLAGPGRFSEIRVTIPGLSDRLLTERLRELEKEGIVKRVTVRGQHTEYRLTPKGEAMAPLVQATAEWAEEWLAGPS